MRTLGKVQLRDVADATGQKRSNLFNRLQSLVQNKLVERTEVYGQVYYRAL